MAFWQRGEDMNLFEKLKNSERFFLISGPCVLEKEDMVMRVAEFLKNYTSRNQIEFIFKASYRKANRSSLQSAMGPGLEEGLRLLQKVKNALELPILTDVHETAEVAAVAEIADVIQIPAFLSRQTDLIVAAAASGRIVNIKKGQFMAPENMKAASDKALSTGNAQIILTERGTFFGYHDLVVDFRNFAILNSFGFPVVYDITHSLQKPAAGIETGGSPEFAGQLACAALATGKVQGLFLETHPEPSQALSDAATQLQLEKLPAILDKCLQIDSVI
jgi:2-dehydro-3-deoxyphosphooctonate aldolase (KDO 8-P synthase)